MTVTHSQALLASELVLNPAALHGGRESGATALSPARAGGREHPPWKERSGKTTGPRHAAGPCKPRLLEPFKAGLPRRYPGSAGETQLCEIDYFFFFFFLNQDYFNFQGLMESSCNGEATLR